MQRSFELELGEKSYLIRPSYEAIEMIEDKLGQSILSLVAAIQTISHLRIKAVVVVIHACLISTTEETLSESDVGNLIVEGGYGTYMALTAKILNGAISAGPEDPEELPEDKGKSEPDNES